MGQSTNAILAFGFDLGEEINLAEIFGVTDEDEAAEFEFNEWVLKQAGVHPPKNGTAAAFERYDKERLKALAACPVEWVDHCSAEYPMYFLALSGTAKVARRGYPEVVTFETPTKEAIDSARAFCKKHGIEWKAPSWHIFSMWS